MKVTQKALLVIDMLEDFVYEGGRLYIGDAAKKVLPEVKKAVEKAREEQIPVFFVCDNHREDDAEFEMFPCHCIQGTKGAQIAKELNPKPEDHIIYKRRFSAFFGTDLDLTLRELGVKEIVLVGVCTNICVLYTAADARMLNYKVSVVKDAVASFDKDAHEFALKELKNTLGTEIIEQ